MNKVTRLLSVAALLSGAAITPGLAADGANARLAFADKLSMYSNRIVSSACAFTLSEAPYESRGFLSVASREINRILAALENGDRALGIPSAEEDARILELLDDIHAQWDPAFAMGAAILEGGASESDVAALTARGEAITEMSFRLVTAISNQYTDAETLRLSDAIRLQIAGRQRMLSQKMSLEACTIQKANDADARLALTKTIQMFELSALALRKGMPAVGLIPTADAGLLGHLDNVDRLWSELKWPLKALPSGEIWDAETQNRMYVKLNDLAHHMDKTVVAYTKAASAAGS